MKTFFLSLFSFLTCAGIAASDRPEVSFLFAYDPDHPEEPITRRIATLARRDNDFEPVKWGALTLPGAGGRAAFMLALAGASAPDIYKAWFHILRHDVEQGFVYPLDEWIAPESVAQDDLWDRVRCFNSHVWALSAPNTAYYGIVYRKDIVAQCGLDPESPPATWSAFREWCRKLNAQGRRAFAIENRPWGFLPWVQSAGGDVIGEKPDGGYCATFDCEQAVAAACFLQDLVRDGSIRAMPSLSEASELGNMFINGEIAAVFGGEDLVRRLTEVLDFPPQYIGLMPFPARDGPEGKRVLQAHRHFYAMSESVAHRTKHERDIIFKCLEALSSQELVDEEVRRNVEEGRSMWCKPSDLKRLGYESELASMSPGIKNMYRDLETGAIVAVTEPWVGFWQAASDIIQRKFLGILLSDWGKDMDCRAALQSINREANRGLMFDSDKSEIERRRPIARIILGTLIACALVAIALAVRFRHATSAAHPQSTSSRTPWRFSLSAAFLAPAIVSILLWSYYPLIKGAMMAFQDYHIVGQSVWTGLDNFIRVSTDKSFYLAWVRTFEYVGITLALGFFSPIILAIALCEIPRFKIFFRFLYFLPHLTSALVVTLLWKLMFDPTENGILNRIIMSVGLERQAWLQSPAWAMVCCIIPGVWAGAGISSLIYIAALSSLPPSYYEAAAIDGAGFFSRLRHVTLPQLYPLMIINFVGAFIAAFQGMGSIFLLTFGGPGDATQVVSLQIWKEAYNNLRFSTATTMAWYLGIALIAFTCLQIRFLRKVEFKRASG